MSGILAKTYKVTVKEWQTEQEATGTFPPAYFAGAQAYAAYLDSFKTIDTHMQLVAMIAARQVDADVLKVLIDFIGEEKAQELAKPILARYKRK